MVWTFLYHLPYDALDAPMREYRVPAHDEDEARMIFRRAFPNAEQVSIAKCERRP